MFRKCPYHLVALNETKTTSRICFKIIHQVKSDGNRTGCKLMTIVAEGQVRGGSLYYYSLSFLC